MIIYKITNLVNNKNYIGLTTQKLNHRISCNRNEIKRNKELKQRIIMALKKHGFNNFLFEQIDVATTKPELKDKEIYWIKELNSTDVELGRTPWNKNTVGAVRKNKVSFNEGKTAPNKGRKKLIIDGKIRFVKVEGR